MSRANRISEQWGVPVAVLMASPQNGKGYDAQAQFVAELKDDGLAVEVIGRFFGQSPNWVTQRILRHRDNESRGEA